MIRELPDLDPLTVPLSAFAGDGSELVLARRTLEVMWIRPGDKARVSVGTVGDGGSADGDGKANARVQIEPSRLHRLLGAQERGLGFAGGDVVFVVDSESLAITATTVPQTVAAGGER
ncbi:MAG: hypothetical protein AAF604_03375 [Acidobacteriota bacterium]